MRFMGVYDVSRGTQPIQEKIDTKEEVYHKSLPSPGVRRTLGRMDGDCNVRVISCKEGCREEPYNFS